MNSIYFKISLVICTIIAVVGLPILSTRYQRSLVELTEVTTPQPASHKAEKYLLAEAALLGITDNASYYFKDLGSSNGEETSLEPTRSWIPASTIKAYVAIEAFRQARVGLINFDQTVTIQARNVVPTELESDEFPRLREGVSATVRQLVEAMITQSDNIAYNTLLDLLDRRSINNTLHDLGLTESVVGQKLNLDDTQAAADINTPGYQPNTTTAKDFAALFDLLYSNQIPGSENILAIFKRQKIQSMIPALLPSNTPVAHKTGDWGQIYHDGGIIYKPQDAFILTIFTNAGDPSVLANLARVAYFRNAEAVGVLPAPQATSQNNYPTVYLAQADVSQVLSSNTDTTDKFPTITASDLGISKSDLTTDTQDAIKVKPAIITPNSALYGLKRSWEDLEYRLATSSDQKTNILLAQSLARLSEARALYNQKQPAAAAAILDQSQSTLAQAATLAKTASSPDALLAKTEQINNLQFATLATVGNQIPNSAKEQFVDTVYRLYQKNQATVAPAVKSSPISNPTAQKPAILTVTSVSSDKITAKTDDGQTKEMLVSNLTPVRQTHTQAILGPETIQPGEKIAIISQTNKSGQIIPQFILSKLPADLPSRIKGTVLEVNPQDKSLKVLQNNGQQVTVGTTSQTITQSSQTSVSLEGIRAGSQVVVYTSERAAPAAVKATTITVTKNSSGKEEKKKKETKPPAKKSSSLFPWQILFNFLET